MTSTPPRHPRRVLDLHVLRAEDRAHRLDQDQADAPGREQRLERPAVEEADHACARAPCRPAPTARNATGIAASRYAVERAGQRSAAEQVLDDVGRVGADHHQLAVRHVDDAHQAVGDRQARAPPAAGCEPRLTPVNSAPSDRPRRGGRRPRAAQLALRRAPRRRARRTAVGRSSRAAAAAACFALRIALGERVGSRPARVARSVLRAASAARDQLQHAP